MAGAETEKASFSETYWNLHRNSLIFSATLLAFGLPGVKFNETQTVLIFTIEGVAQNLVLFGLFIAASYALFAYWLEWRHEALEQLKKRENLRSSVSDARAAIESIRTLLGQAAGGNANIVEQLTKAEVAVVDLSETLHRRISNNKELSHAQRQARNRLDTLLIDYLKKIIDDPVSVERLRRTERSSSAALWIMRHNLPPDQSEAERWESMLPMIPEVEETLHELVATVWAAKIGDSALPELSNVIELISSRKVEVQRAESLQIVTDQLQTQRSLISRVRGRLSGESRLETARVYGVGAVVPFLLYGAAVIAGGSKLCGYT